MQVPILAKKLSVITAEAITQAEAKIKKLEAHLEVVDKYNAGLVENEFAYHKSRKWRKFLPIKASDKTLRIYAESLVRVGANTVAGSYDHARETKRDLDSLRIGLKKLKLLKQASDVLTVDFIEIDAEEFGLIADHYETKKDTK